MNPPEFLQYTPNKELITSGSNFKETVANLIRGIGGRFYNGKIYWGYTSNWNDDSEQEVSFDREVGWNDSKKIVTSLEGADFSRDIHPISESCVFINEFYFGPELKECFEFLIKSLPADKFCRILQPNENDLTVYIYDGLNQREEKNLLEQIEPKDDLVAFTQGEWVLVDGNDPNHQIASFGKHEDACRYWLIYDPVTKRAAATHLDLTTDIETVQEMTTALLSSGSQKSDLIVRGSNNTPANDLRKIKKMFPSLVLDLNEHAFIFDVQTGELGQPNEAVMKTLHNDEAALTRAARDIRLRIEYEIGNISRYCSPSYKRPATKPSSEIAI